MALTTQEFERFVAETFDSEEAVMIVLALWKSGFPLTARGVLERLERDFGVKTLDQRLVAEKRIELRLRDLVGRGIVQAGRDGGFRYLGDEMGLSEQVQRMSVEFDTRRGELNRLIYATSARARRLAEAFRL